VEILEAAVSLAALLAGAVPSRSRLRPGPVSCALEALEARVKQRWADSLLDRGDSEGALGLAERAMEAATGCEAMGVVEIAAFAPTLERARRAAGAAPQAAVARR
jgi:hypothetical protein